MFLKRLDRLGVAYTETRVDYIGYNSLYRDKLAACLSPSPAARDPPACGGAHR